MADPSLLRKFKKFAALFLEFEKENSTMSSSLATSTQTMYTIELRKEEFKSLWNKVKNSYEKFNVDCECFEEQEKEASDLFKQCREAYITCAAIMGQFSQSLSDRSVLSSTVLSTSQVSQQFRESRGHNHRLRLPPCTTEIFHGDYLSWPSFRDMFKAVYIDCQSITPVEKLFYLRQNTQGEALEIVKKSQLTNEGFEIAWSNLKDRYENKRILVNSQLKILFNLLPVKSESAQDIKRLQREINNCITSLKLHDICIESWDPIFVFLCSTRLPVTTLSLWEQTIKDKTEISKWKDLDYFLTARFQSLETVFDFTHTGAVEASGRSDMAASNKKYCEKFLRMTPEERFAVVKRNNLCLNCFSNNHRLHQCTIRRRLILDPGSQASFISERLRRRIRLQTTRVNARISGLNNALAGSTEKQCSFILSSVGGDNFEVEVSALVLPQLTGKLPSSSISIPESFSLGDMPLADPLFGKSDQVDILIGADFYPQILLDGVQRNVLGSLVAQETIFGWVLTGQIDNQRNSFTTLVSFYTETALNEQLERFWKLEEPPCVNKMTPEEEYCEELYRRTTRRSPNGRFIVGLPFRPQYIEGKGLGLSRTKAVRQFLRNEASLLRKPDMKPMYDAVIEEYKSLGHMVRIDRSTEGGSEFYLPHHAVIKPERISTKLRVVFNASCPTSSGLSLNDTLYPGPVLQNDLMLLIIRWRFYRYVFNGDIEKMYRQILLDDRHTKFQRIVFRTDPRADVQDFEMKTVTFGLNCAPFLAIRTLLQLASEIEKELPLAAKILRHMMYVDDALAGAHEVSLAIKARDQLISALSSAGFSMRKWTSNDERILQGLPKDHLLAENFLEIDAESKAKTLGIRWNAKSDNFYFSVNPILRKANFTKREVLSIIAALFDPAGWLGPVIVVAKMLMQQIWNDKTGWDENLTDSSSIRWNQFISDYDSLNAVKLERWIGFEPCCNFEIHGFSDASERAYGACVYARIESNGVIRTNLLFAKSRVAPLKTVSLPRLELCGALLLAELMGALRTDLSLDNKDTKYFCWCDSTIVLAWLQKPPSAWGTFVSNRVSKILDLVGRDCWGHVRSDLNPADIISRGIRSQQLIDNTLWWQGPPSMRCLANGRPIHRNSNLLNLNPFIDEEGLMRIGGRLSNANVLSFNEKHPIILPYNCKFSQLLAYFIHEITLHGGIQLMLRVLRSEFWIPRSKNMIKYVIGHCKICNICAKKSREQIMSSLPIARTLLDRPFTRTGVDFAGPYDIKNYTGRACLITKGYVSIFVCFATKAIHLEAVSDLSTVTFLAAFARFVSRRGCPKDMYSDNGTNFVGASRVLRAEFRNFLRDISSEVVHLYVNNGVNWHFNPVAAPHMGGLWEAGVKSFKHHFNRVAFNLKYTFEEFSTLLARVESCLNSRPLCPLSEDVSCIDVLTPGHFLIGGPLLSPPEPQILDAPISIVNRWQRVKAINQNFCLRWKEEYLKEIIKRNKWKTDELNLKINDMVVVREENLPPNEWRLGRITKVFPGADGKVRVAEIRTARGQIVRPIVKLVFLPVD
ncbi:uncharacterized protein LOC142235098 [Haematobia irritans]|uniref:uncharacterized protein LOC142235098 n=1 Tax=Haematobia irritans TaxID=7368 RepID=UPI003F4FC42D